MRLKIWNILLVLVVAVTTAAQEAPHCETTDTPRQCWHRVFPAEVPTDVTDVTDPAAEMAKETVGAANTGLTSLVSPSGSALKDFLSILSASLDQSSLAQNGTTVTFDWNPKVGVAQPIKFEAVLAKPEMSSNVTSALGSNSAGITALKDSLNDVDDVTASVSYSPVNESYGRSIEPHRTAFHAMADTVFGSVQVEKSKLFTSFLDQNGVPFADKPIALVFANDPPKQMELIARIEDVANKAKAQIAFVDTLTKSFAKLLNNQPQPYGSVMYHDRKNIVGPDEMVVKATYEYGFKNLNTFRRTHKLCVPEVIETNGAKCAQLLEEYAGPTGPDEAADDGRMAFSLEYHDARPVHVNLTQYAVKFDVDSGRSLVYSITGGWTMAPRPDRRSGRIDLAVNYEDIRNAAVITSIPAPAPADVKDRLIGSITYTQKISDTMSFPISLVYANHGSYLTNVDRKLNAHFGIQFKMPNGK